jgi:hypothetical protein
MLASAHQDRWGRSTGPCSFTLIFHEAHKRIVVSMVHNLLQVIVLSRNMQDVAVLYFSVVKA